MRSRVPFSAHAGQDVPEDIAGGLKHATELSWRSPVRLCILIGDAPCHGSQYHSFRDNYPGGCPKGLDPSELLYTLMVRGCLLSVIYLFIVSYAVFAMDQVLWAIYSRSNSFTYGTHALIHPYVRV